MYEHADLHAEACLSPAHSFVRSILARPSTCLCWAGSLSWYAPAGGAAQSSARQGVPSAQKRSPVRPRVQAALTAPAPVYVLGGSIVPLGAAGFNVTSQARARSA